MVSNDGGDPGQAARTSGRVELGPEDERSTLRFKGTPAVAIGVVRQSKSNIIAGGRGDPRRAAPDPGRRCRRACTLDAGLRPVDLREPLDPGGAGDAGHRGRPGRADHLRLPAEPAGDDHPGPRDPDVHRRDLRDHVLPRLLDQQLHAARADAGHRHRGGRRDHRAGERLPAPGGAGRRPREAAINGTREIAFAVIATTISLVAVFTPLAFLKGSTGRLFNEFGIAVAGSVIISGFVALTLTPMLCAKILRVPQRHGRALPRAGERLQPPGHRLRPHAGAGAAAPRPSSWPASVLVTLGAVFVFRSLKREFVPPGGPGLVLLLHHRAGGLVARLHRRVPAPGGGDPRRRPRRSTATSAW